MENELLLLQGAMGIELDVYIESLTEVEELEFNGFLFWKGRLAGKSVVISKTEMGVLNATIATMTAIEQFRPDYVINQGTAGGHVEDIHTNDIVIAQKAEYLNSLIMPEKKEGEGSDSLLWFFDKKIPAMEADESLIQYFQKEEYKQGNLLTGTIGTGDIFSREADRIHWIHQEKDNLCEDMETYAVYQVCQRLQVPCVSIRVISNNELLGESFDRNSARVLQKHILKCIQDR